MTEFEDRLRTRLRTVPVELAFDPADVLSAGRRALRRRRLAAGWAVAGAAALVVLAGSAVLSRAPSAVPAAPAPLGAPVATPGGPGALAGTEWDVVRLRGRELVAGSSITLRFGEATVAGFGGCNGYGWGQVNGEVVGGSYAQEGDRLTIDHPVTTLKLCRDEAVNRQETDYHSALVEVARFTEPGTRLELRDAAGAVLVELVRSPLALAGTAWVVTSIDNTAIVAGTRPTLEFGQGTVSADAGCGPLEGSFSQHLKALTIRVEGGVTGECRDRRTARQQRELVAALGGTAGFGRNGHLLTLIGADGNWRLEAELQPLPTPSAAGSPR